MKIGPKSTLQIKTQKKLREFVEYQTQFEESAEKLDDRVDFCVNVDIGEWTEQMNELQTKIPPQFFC
jgi:hypothetical protein